MSNTTDSLRVELGRRSYDILVGRGLLTRAGVLAGGVTENRQAVIVTDSNVAPLYLTACCEAFREAGFACQSVEVAAGEAQKSYACLETLINDLLGRRVERGTLLVALGGGVIGDLLGFAAAVTLRGMDFIQIPTTLLAQVDSSVGGKTGINAPAGKNLIGAFHQPRLVLADTDSLQTLPRRQLLAGYAEVVKYGLIDRPDFFAWLENHGRALLAGDADLLRHAIVTCCAAKAGIVADDERESGVRALLNLGHTFGHALEAETGYSEKLLHGEAVAIGMVMAFDLSVRLRLCPPEDAERLRRHLAEVGLPTGLTGLVEASWRAERLLSHMASDKKVKNERITYVLARGIGKAFLSSNPPASDVAQLLDDFIQGRS